MAASEQVVNGYPGPDPQVALALANLLDCQKLRQRYGLLDEAGVQKYFQDFATKFQGNRSTQSKIIFTLAAFTYEKDKKKAAEQMEGAYDASSEICTRRPRPVRGRLDPARKSSIKLWTKVYQESSPPITPVPKTVEPANAPRDIADAQAIALFGEGKVLAGEEQQRGGQTEVRRTRSSNSTPWSSQNARGEFRDRS